MLMHPRTGVRSCSFDTINPFHAYLAPAKGEPSLTHHLACVPVAWLRRRRQLLPTQCGCILKLPALKCISAVVLPPCTYSVRRAAAAPLCTTAAACSSEGMTFISRCATQPCPPPASNRDAVALDVLCMINYFPRCRGVCMCILLVTCSTPPRPHALQ